MKNEKKKVFVGEMGFAQNCFLLLFILFMLNAAFAVAAASAAAASLCRRSSK